MTGQRTSGSATLRGAIATALCLAVHGCADVDGGAVELSWKLRPASSPLDAKFVDCDSRLPGTGPVTRIRLDWQVGDHDGFASWRCDDNHGVTGFDLPAGDALLWFTPECGPEGAQVPASPLAYTAPAPVLRRVNLGDTVSLGAIELVVQVWGCSEAQPCICQ